VSSVAAGSGISVGGNSVVVGSGVSVWAKGGAVGSGVSISCNGVAVALIRAGDAAKTGGSKDASVAHKVIVGAGVSVGCGEGNVGSSPAATIRGLVGNLGCVSDAAP